MISNSKEEWRPIEGYEGLYRVSNLGNIQSKCSGKWKPRKLSISNHGSGYIVILYGPDKKYHGTTVARMVAQAFLPNPNNEPDVIHKDGNNFNNRVDNLQWGNRGGNRKPYKIKATWIEDGREMVFDSAIKASEYFGCHKSVVYRGVNKGTLLRKSIKFEKVK